MLSYLGNWRAERTRAGEDRNSYVSFDHSLAGSLAKLFSSMQKDMK